MRPHRKLGRPRTGRTAVLRAYVRPEIAKAIRREAKRRGLTQGQVVEEAYMSRAVFIPQDDDEIAE